MYCIDHSKKYLLCRILILSGDIPTNPGPNYRYPGGVCSKPVKSNRKGIFCDVCELWLHCRCIGMTVSEYQKFQQVDSGNYYCDRCMLASLPNFSESFFADDDLGQGEEALIPRPLDMLDSQKTTETISLSGISGFKIANKHWAGWGYYII